MLLYKRCSALRRSVTLHTLLLAADRDTIFFFQGVPFHELFGSTLCKGDIATEVGTKAVLKGKSHVGIFFGAAWSGSCKQFMEPLVKVYNKLVEEKGKSFEIVYVPATVPGRPPEDEASFKELLSTMPWLAVPLHRKATHKKLTRRFQVRQIPMLVLLDADGKTIHRDITPAVTHIIEDADGDTFAGQFPWAEKRHTNIKQMLGETFLKGDGTEVSIGELDGKYIGVLLSATWHWQCRRFQQMLEYMYEKLKGEGKQFEIIDMVRLVFLFVCVQVSLLALRMYQRVRALMYHVFARVLLIPPVSCRISLGRCPGFACHRNLSRPSSASVRLSVSSNAPCLSSSIPRAMW